MKTKVLSIVLASFTLFSVVSCRKDGDSISINKKNTAETAQVNVKVLKNGQPSNGTTVYLFDSESGPSSSLFKPFYSFKSVVTENGVAPFELKEIDLNIDSQTTFYFAVFDKNEKLLAYQGVTVKKGETKTITINL